MTDPAHPRDFLRAARPSISCVMPAFNESANLPIVLAEVRAQLLALTDCWELIVVDDGSRDATPAAMLPWLTRPGIRYVRLSRNFGKEAALTAGIDRAEGDITILMDADGQHQATLVPRMIEAWRGGADMVCAARVHRNDESWSKRVGTWLFYRLVNRGKVEIPVDAGDFRLMDRSVVAALRALPERNRFMKGLYAWVGFHVEIIDYTPAERITGHSTFSMRSLLRLAFTGVTAFSTLPLRLWSALGALIAFGAIGFAVFTVIDHMMHGTDVPGWATLVTGIMLFSGLQLLSIGILGEYIGRIYEEVKRRPIYVVGGESGRGALAPGAEPVAPSVPGATGAFAGLGSHPPAGTPAAPTSGSIPGALPGAGPRPLPDPRQPTRDPAPAP